MKSKASTAAVIAAALLMSACGGGSKAPLRTMPSGTGYRTAAATHPFPSMANPTDPVPGQGSGGSAGPFSSAPQNADIPSNWNANHTPPDERDHVVLDAQQLRVSPAQVIQSQDASFGDANAPSSPSSQVRSTLSAARRTMNISPTNSFTGNGDQDLPGATNGTYILAGNSSGAFYVYTMTGAVSKQFTYSQLYCGTNPLPICSAGGFAGDNRIIYDNGSSRWATTALWVYGNNTVATVVLAVSKSSDPTGAWSTYQFPACGSTDTVDKSDQPHIGFNNQWIAVTSACNSGNPGLAVFDKANLYAGGALTLNTNWFEFNDPVQNGNRDNPVLTYGPTVNNREYLTASITSGGYAAVLYSHIEGSTDAPVFYSGTDQVTTSFPASGAPSTVDAPNCAGCMTASWPKGWMHSSGVWTFTDGHAYIMSTAVFNDAAYSNASQIVNVAISDAGAATAMNIYGGTGWGAMSSEITMPLVTTLTYNRALVAYDASDSSFYPGVMAAQWNVDLNTIEFNTALAQGSFVPSAADAGRWVDWIDAFTPIPGSSQMVLGAHIAQASAGDTQRSDYWTTVSISATPTPQPTPRPAPSPTCKLSCL